MDISYYKKYEPIFGEYYIKRDIGEGSYGKVMEIEREDLGKRYTAALKVVTIPQSKSEINSLLAQNKDASKYCRAIVERFRTEVELMAELKGNSHIVSYENHKFVQHDDGIGWDILMQMEMLTPLYEHILKNDFKEKDIITLGIHISRALELCQKHDIVHRDVKPENIFISKDGYYKLGDFGVAKIADVTATGTIAGTKSYMAPEVFNHEKYGSTADIYSLGLVLYGLLNRHNLPFETSDDDFEAKAIAKSKRLCGMPAPAPVDGSPALKAVVLKAIEADPANRFQSASEMREALERAARNPQGEVVKPKPEKDNKGQNSSAKKAKEQPPKPPVKPPVEPPKPPKPRRPRVKPPTPPKPAEKKQGGGKKFLALAGIAAVAVIGVIFVLAGSGASSSSSDYDYTTEATSGVIGNEEEIIPANDTINGKTIAAVQQLIDKSSSDDYMGVEWGSVQAGNIRIKCPADSRVRNFSYDYKEDSMRHMSTRYEGGNVDLSEYISVSYSYSGYNSMEEYMNDYISKMDTEKKEFKAGDFSGYLILGDSFYFVDNDIMYNVDLSCSAQDQETKESVVNYVLDSLEYDNGSVDLPVISGEVEMKEITLELPGKVEVFDYEEDYDDNTWIGGLHVRISNTAYIDMYQFRYEGLKDEFKKDREKNQKIQVDDMDAYTYDIGDLSHSTVFMAPTCEYDFKAHGFDSLTSEDIAFHTKVIDSVKQK